MMKNVIAIYAAFLIIMSVSVPAAAEYWEWGWGSYGVGRVEDVARFDWSCINFGNIPANKITVDRCNRILELNPNHKFLLRLWPIGGYGKVLRNASVFDYHYSPGVKEKVLSRLETQIKLIRDNISNPQAICALTFCEELPGHVSTFSIMRRAGQKNEVADFKELQPYREQVKKELGEEFDPARQEHMLFWGSKFVEMLNDSHRKMKELCPTARVIYWQATGYRTIDMAGKYQYGILPYRIGDILKSGDCDGVFAYPNNRNVWNMEAVEVLKKYNCVMFSQVSTPSYMRLETFDKTVDTALWRHPGNLGSFVYAGHEPRPNAFNAIDAAGNSGQWANIDFQNRWFGWKYRVGLDIAEKILSPELTAVYDFTGKKPGDIVNISVQLLNRKDASWYGGDGGLTVIEPEVELILPACLELAVDNSIPARLNIGKMGAGEVKLINSWYATVKSDPVPDMKIEIKVTGNNIPETSAIFTGMKNIPEIHGPYRISRLYPKWLVPDGKAGENTAVEIKPVAGEALRNPAVRAGGTECVYRALLAADEVLTISRDGAYVHTRELFAPRINNFNRPDDKETPVTEEGYLLFSTPQVSFHGGQNYHFILNGNCLDGAIAHVRAEYSGKRNGEDFKEAKDIVYSELKKLKEEKAFTAPEADAGTGKMLLRFYRAKKQGKMALQSFSLRRMQPGRNVSDKLMGTLPVLSPPAYWEYSDDNQPGKRYQELSTPVVEIRFVKEK